MIRLFCKKDLPLPPLKMAECRRYLGAKENTQELETLLREAEERVASVIAPAALLRILPLSLSGDLVTVGDLRVESADLAKNLAGCREVALMAGTLGAEADRLIRKESVSSVAMGLCVSAVLSERIERVMDLVEERLAKEGRRTRPRFSPGYGDLNVSFGDEILRSLDAQRRIGLGMTMGHLMVPTKSVSAVVGLLD